MSTNIKYKIVQAIVIMLALGIAIVFSALAAPPASDNISDTTIISGLPFSEQTNAVTEKSSLSQYEINTIIIYELPYPPDPDNIRLFLRIIKPCPNIDYKMRVLTPNPNLDPGISHYQPGHYSVIPGASEIDCKQVSLSNNLVEK